MTYEEIMSELSESKIIDINEMTVGIEYSDKGVIISIIIYVNDEKQAKTLSETVNKCERIEDILCRGKARTREITRMLSLSNGFIQHPFTTVIIFIFMILTFIS